MQNAALIRCLVAVALLALGGCSSSPTTESATEDSDAAPTAAVATPGAPAARPAPQPAPPPAPKPVVLAAGTEITVTVDEILSTKDKSSGDRFEASVAAPVRVYGKEVIPRGAKAVGRVIAAEQAGRVRGSAELSVALDSIMINGKTVPVEVAAVTESSEGRDSRTAIGVGAGAAAGAIIGAIGGARRARPLGPVQVRAPERREQSSPAIATLPSRRRPNSHSG